MIWLGSLAFFALGIVLVVLGVHQVEMTRDLRLDLSAFGLLGAMLALGFGAGLTAAGPLVDRVPPRVLFPCACAIAALALFGVDAEAGQARLALQLLALGAGGGCTVTLLNAALLERYAARAAPSLAFVHAMATAGAASGPWLIAWGQSAAGAAWPATFHALGAVYVGLGLLALAAGPRRERGRERGRSAVREHDSGTAAAPRARLLSPALAALAAINFAYVGVETGLTLFAVPWAESQGFAAAAGRGGISAFWFALMAGRLLLVVRKPTPSPPWLIACGAGGALAIVAAAWGTWSPVVALALAGACLGPAYPVTIALTGRRFAGAPGTALGLVAGAGALGGFVLPWLCGVLGDAIAVAAAVAMLGGCASLIALGAIALRRMPESA